MNQTLSSELFLDPQKLSRELSSLGIALTPEEAISIKERLGRVPTLAELFVFDIEWSEHCSYKSSKHLLKKYLPVSGRFVIQGPEEDAGIVEFTSHEGHRYGIVIAHESHNHPSQVLPIEGAATGIGGIVRDVDCMGASVIGVADPLRFGDPKGPNAQRTQSIVSGVVEGIYKYGNALGIPNVGGDVVYDQGFDDNCLVNVVALGILREEEIVHSRVPEGGVGYDVILVGKPTDRSGFGGASFASGTLDQEDEEENKGAVQIPDPFLKNVLLHHKATHQVRQLARKKNLSIGMKDLGAGGIACATSEICASAGYGIEIQLEQVHIAEQNLPPEIILCAETQERYVLVVPPEFTQDVLRIYNEDWELPTICSGAGAYVIGTVLQEPVMRVHYQNKMVVDLPIDFVVEGIRYDRASREPQKPFHEPDVSMPSDLNKFFLDLLSKPNMASKEKIFRHYDSEVQGNTVIRPGEADASLIMPLDGCNAGIALSVDGNPYYGEISPYWGGANAVAEAMRNVAAIGACPRALTDCLNYGNPEVPEDFWALEEGIKGIADAAKKLNVPRGSEEAIPFVSGNVSLYNQSASGRSIPPSPIIACVGVMEDVSHAITMEAKQPGNLILLVGERFNELGGSEYYRALEVGQGVNVPQVRFEEERALIQGTLDAIQYGLVESAHDVSMGGVLVSAAEMLLANHPANSLGMEIHLKDVETDLREDLWLFSESSGMLLEVHPERYDTLITLMGRSHLHPQFMGYITSKGNLLVRSREEKTLLDLSVETMRKAWRGEFGLTLAT